MHILHIIVCLQQACQSGGEMGLIGPIAVLVTHENL